MKKHFFLKNLALCLTFLLFIFACTKEPNVDSSSITSKKNKPLNQRSTYPHEILLFGCSVDNGCNLHFTLTKNGGSPQDIYLCNLDYGTQTCDSRPLSTPDLKCFKWDNADTDWGSCKVTIDTGIYYLREIVGLGQNCGDMLKIEVTTNSVSTTSTCTYQIQRYGPKCFCYYDVNSCGKINIDVELDQ